MSASEKLRALANPPMPFEPDFDKRYTEHHELSLAFQDALPLIADVVEAAERVDAHPPPLRMLDDTFVLHRSLTALRDALEPRPIAKVRAVDTVTGEDVTEQYVARLPDALEGGDVT